MADQTKETRKDKIRSTIINEPRLRYEDKLGKARLREEVAVDSIVDAGSFESPASLERQENNCRIDIVVELERSVEEIGQRFASNSRG